MQLSVYEIISKINFMDRIIERIDDCESINDYAQDIREILDEYSEILKQTKVKI